MKKLIILTFAFILLSCSQNNQTNTANKNLSIMVDSQTVCAVFNNLWKYELFVYNEQNNLIESKVLKFVTNSKKNKILREMNNCPFRRTCN